jgi:hypothetical protein
MRDEYEPSFTCEVCGSTGLVGDWIGESCVLVGGPAVTFFNWPPRRASFVMDMRAALGGRTGIVHSAW